MESWEHLSKGHNNQENNNNKPSLPGMISRETCVNSAQIFIIVSHKNNVHASLYQLV